MKRAVNYLSLLSIVALLWAISSSFAPTAVTAHARFQGMPIGVRTAVHFSAEDVSSLTGTALERRNQLRDWLLYTVLSDAGLDEDALSQVLFDLPPLRTGYTEPASRFEYGTTRSRMIGTSDVVALVPRADPAQRIDDLAEVADLQYKTTGVRAPLVHVFEYELADYDDEAWVTRLPDVSGDELFSSTFGYVETTIHTAADLETFLHDANDITSARFVSGALVLGGRRVSNGTYRGLRVEDVAALWQAETGPRSVQKEIDAFDARWSARRYQFDFERVQLERERDEELARLKASIKAKSGGKMTEASGFSLDPVFNFDALKAVVDSHGSLFRDVLAKSLPAASHSYADIIKGLEKHDPGPLLDTLYAMRTSDAEITQLISQLLEEELEDSKFQQARYDGSLQGTEVGMVLFYTDLLAKLWAMDFEYSAPSERVEDFVPLLKIRRSPIFARELEELSGTRLWFGPRDDGYQKTADGMLMARTATRVYAASSSMLKPGEEAEPNASSAAFLWWWNNHYNDVASAEREYQRLNEVMKWGLVLGRMTDQEFSSLSFLESVKVARTNWFPAWAKQNPQLTFKTWQRVQFLPRGYKQTTTEALPLLRSRLEEGHQISGGVSLPSRRLLSERPTLSEATNVLLRRSTVMEETSTFGGRVLKGFDDLTFEIKQGQSVLERTIIAKPRPAARLRGADLELRNGAFDYTLAKHADGLSLRMSQGASRVGEFSVRRVQNGFETAFRNHEMERARTLLRVVDDASARKVDVATEVGRISGVERVLSGTDSAVYVKLPSVEGRWLKIAEEGAPTVKMGDGIDLRYASLDRGRDGKRWTAAWVDDGVVSGDLVKAPFVRVRANGSALDGIVAEPIARGPPAGATPLDVSIGSGKVSAWHDGDGWAYVPRRAETDVWETARAVRAAGHADVPDAVHDVHRYLAAGDYQRTAQVLASHPDDAPTILQGYRSSSLEHAESLMAAGQPREAVSELDAVGRLFPNDPDIRLRRAMALIGDNRSQSGLHVLDEGLRSHAADAAPRLHQTAERVIARVADRDAGNLATAMRGAELNRRLAASGPLKAAVAVRPDRTGQLRMEVRLLDWQTAVAPKPIAGGRPIYVEIGADFDPVVGVRQSVDQVVSDATVVNRLTSWEVVAARPETIVDAKTGVRYGRVARGVSRANLATNLTRQECASEVAASTTGDCGDNIYLVRRSTVASN